MTFRLGDSFGSRFALGSGLIVTGVFLVSRALALAVGISFNQAPLTVLWQILDPLYLEGDLLRSVWYLHSQPPLFNLIIGLFLQAFGANFSNAMWLLYALTGLLGAWAYLSLLRQLTNWPVISLVVTCVIISSPTMILYETVLYYEYPVCWLLVIGFWGLRRLLVDGRLGAGCVAFSCFAAVVLLRSAFHPLWLAGLAGTPLLLGRNSRQIALAAALPLLLVGSVCLKNEIVFGVAGLSSWGPLNIAKMPASQLPVLLREQLGREGRMAPEALLKDFPPPEALLAITGPLPPTGIPVLDDLRKPSGQPNFNHLVYTKVGRDYLRNARVGLLSYPQSFMKLLCVSLYYFNTPPTQYWGMEDNCDRIVLWERLYNVMAEGQPAALFGPLPVAMYQAPRPDLLRIGYVSVALFLLAIAASVAMLARTFRGGAGTRGNNGAFLTCLALTLLYSIVIVNALDVYDNNRARVMVEPLMWLAVLWLVSLMRRALQARKAPMKLPPSA